MVDIGCNIFAELQLFLWCLVTSITVFFLFLSFYFFMVPFLSYFSFWVLKEMNSKSDNFHLPSKLFINYHHARSLDRIILPKPKPLYMVYHLVISLIRSFVSEVSTFNDYSLTSDQNTDWFFMYAGIRLLDLLFDYNKLHQLS